MKRYYLAYGSNLNMLQMAARCPGARRVGTGIIKDYELLFKGSKIGSYLTIEKRKGAHVPVGIWEVTPADEERLDRYEGYPLFYYKRQIPIKLKDELQHRVRRVTAFVYIMHEDRPIGIPSDRYMKTCFDGYDDFDFDKALLREAEIRSWKAAGWEAI